MASPDAPRNDELAYLIRFLIRTFARQKGLDSRTTGSKLAFVLGVRRAPEPDVACVPAERAGIIQRTHCVGPSDIAAEIVSEDSRERDYTLKKQIYEEAGVREYWLIDPAQQHCEFYRLQNGRHLLVPLEKERLFRSEVLSGFWLDVTWLLADPLSNEFTCLERILANNLA